MGKNGEKLDFPGFERLFPYFLSGANFGTNLGSYFFLIQAGGPKPIFYQVGRFLNVAVTGVQRPSLKTLTSLNKEVRPFFLSDDSIWGLPSVSSLSD